MKVMYILSIIPFIGMLGFLPFVNKVEPFVFSMPFVMFWVVMWTLLTSLILGIMYKLDPRNKEGDRK
ncbi:DUF3311 domain-containing protein [Domibacillus sp. DTU_2020_1001157_1_SI_ALB_TIR_016]|uniref:DUF3311 domain-containing protein n=1 Tax=Domibacillus sp. DTU_2020_1001157_1_SI_ALB_TIR_016 TaxID=3077789 RepID=UPI0028E22DAE|nr:DUF3311 domain-containing protein [Domibacillus sp. DTU_2020_1001157_1_SI_ALB_TIR_016]WNS78977.1 DUF3311 domain-containing protein [Domibacillus sp. DTU_2020_1001157_1_SI_ALB_TIR_016]